ncbi:hypothetical protein Tco_0564141 [Tanacetum coccineum]
MSLVLKAQVGTLRRYGVRMKRCGYFIRIGPSRAFPGRYNGDETFSPVQSLEVGLEGGIAILMSSLVRLTLPEEACHMCDVIRPYVFANRHFVTKVHRIFSISYSGISGLCRNLEVSVVRMEALFYGGDLISHSVVTEVAVLIAFGASYLIPSGQYMYGDSVLWVEYNFSHASSTCLAAYAITRCLVASARTKTCFDEHNRPPSHRWSIGGVLIQGLLRSWRNSHNFEYNPPILEMKNFSDDSGVSSFLTDLNLARGPSVDTVME